MHVKATPTMKPGDVLRDQYQLVSSIGRGGMGEVFHAVHLPSESNVAIKVVSRAFIGDLLMARLEREAAAASRIKSEFIPQVLDVDRTDDGELFLVMELLHGESLSERLKKCGGILAWEEVKEIGDNVLRGLIDAHAAGVVHRDLKPGNIFIEYLPNGMGRARILDFGVCKLDVGTDGEKLTVTGESVGTIAYMAPEQIRGASKVDERADIYSFAMVVFEALSGRLAYDASGQMALLASKLEKSARPLKSVAQVPIPAALDALVNKCLARKPDDRPPNAKEVLRLWRQLGAATQPPVSVPIISGTIHNPATQTVLTAGTIDAPQAKGRTPFLALAIAAIALSGIIAVAAVTRRPSHDAAAAAGEATAEQVEEVPAPIDTNVAQPTATGVVAPTTTGPTAFELGATPAATPANPASTPVRPRTTTRSSARSVSPPTGGAAKRPATTPATQPTIMNDPKY